MNDSLLEVDHATMRFGGLTALGDFHLDLAAGAFIGIIGPNGAGKTTLFNLLTGIYRPTTGTLRFRGIDLAPLAPHTINRLGIARTFQNIRLFGDLTVAENVTVAAQRMIRTSLATIGCRTRRADAETHGVEMKTAKLLAEFGLAAQADRRANQLPYGQQRKLEMVRALATDPQLLLLDEPAAGMHPTEKKELCELLRSLSQQRGLAMILIEHDMNVVMSLCPHIVVLDYGVTIASGTPDEMRRHPKVIEAYLGESRC